MEPEDSAPNHPSGPTPPPPDQPSYRASPPPPDQPAPPDGKKHRLRNWGIGIAALVVVGAIAVGLASHNNGKKTTGHTTPSATPTVTTLPASAPETTPAVASTSVARSSHRAPRPGYVTPTKRDFSIKLKILSKNCYAPPPTADGACDITYRPQLSIILPSGSLDPSIAYYVTYAVIDSGIDSDGIAGPQVDTLVVTGDRYDHADQDIETASQDDTVTAVITDVEAE